MKTSPHALGLTIGALAGFIHLAWSLLIASGRAGTLVTYWMHLHMVDMPLTILPFNAGKAIILIIATAIVGYIVGYVGGTIWEKVGT